MLKTKLNRALKKLSELAMLLTQSVSQSEAGAPKISFNVNFCLIVYMYCNTRNTGERNSEQSGARREKRMTYGSHATIHILKHHGMAYVASDDSEYFRQAQTDRGSQCRRIFLVYKKKKAFEAWFNLLETEFASLISLVFWKILKLPSNCQPEGWIYVLQDLKKR